MSKIKVMNELLANKIAERTQSEVVQVIGKKIILYRQSKNNPKIVLK